jgi:hypothetical protein
MNTLFLAVVAAAVIGLGYLYIRHLGKKADAARAERLRAHVAPIVLTSDDTKPPSDDDAPAPPPAAEQPAAPAATPAAPAPVSDGTPTTPVVATPPAVNPFELVRGYTAKEAKDRMNQRDAENRRTSQFVPFPAFGVVLCCKKDITPEANKWLNDAGLTSYAIRKFLKGRQTPRDMILAAHAMIPELKRRDIKRVVLFYYGPISALPKIVEVLQTVAEVQVMEYIPAKGYEPGYIHLRRQ